MDEAAGSGEIRLLLLHGYFSGSVAWDGVRRELAARGIRTLAPDQLGYGRFRTRRHRTYTLEAMAEHLRPVMERFRPTHVAGHSMGGIVAMELDRQYPGTFQRIGLVSLPVFESVTDGMRFQALRGRRFGILMRTHGFSHAGCVVLNRTWPLWSRWAPKYAPRKPVEVVQRAFAHNYASHRHGLLEVAFAGHVARLAPQLSAPAVLLHGWWDRTAPLDRAEQIAGEHGWDFEVAHEGANHQIILLQPDVVADWMERKLLGIRPEAAS